VPNSWIFKGRRGGCPFYVYLEDEDAEGIRAGLHVARGQVRSILLAFMVDVHTFALGATKGGVVLKQLGYFVFPPYQLRIFEPNN
jgi:hypothetical protein